MAVGYEKHTLVRKSGALGLDVPGFTFQLFPAQL